MPERQQRCKPDLAAREVHRERSELPLFAVGHFLNDRPCGPFARHGELALVDALRPVLTCMIQAEDARDPLFLCRIAQGSWALTSP